MSAYADQSPRKICSCADVGPEPLQSACVQFLSLPFSVRGWIEMPFRGGPRPGQFVVKIGHQFQHQNLPPPLRLSAAGENPGWYGTCTSFSNDSLVPWTECHGPAVVRGRPGRPAPVGTPPQRMRQLWCHGSARSQGGREPHVLSPVGHYCHTEPAAVWVSTWHFPARRLHRMWGMMRVVG